MFANVDFGVRTIQPSPPNQNPPPVPPRDNPRNRDNVAMLLA